jgi:hypothetical protein
LGADWWLNQSKRAQRNQLDVPALFHRMRDYIADTSIERDATRAIRVLGASSWSRRRDEDKLPEKRIRELKMVFSFMWQMDVDTLIGSLDGNDVGVVHEYLSRLCTRTLLFGEMLDDGDCSYFVAVLGRIASKLRMADGKPLVAGAAHMRLLDYCLSRYLRADRAIGSAALSNVIWSLSLPQHFAAVKLSVWRKLINMMLDSIALLPDEDVSKAIAVACRLHMQMPRNIAGLKLRNRIVAEQIGKFNELFESFMTTLMERHIPRLTSAHHVACAMHAIAERVSSNRTLRESSALIFNHLLAPLRAIMLEPADDGVDGRPLQSVEVHDMLWSMAVIAGDVPRERGKGKPTALEHMPLLDGRLLESIMSQALDHDALASSNIAELRDIVFALQKLLPLCADSERNDQAVSRFVGAVSLALRRELTRGSGAELERVNAFNLITNLIRVDIRCMPYASNVAGIDEAADSCCDAELVELLFDADPDFGDAPFFDLHACAVAISAATTVKRQEMVEGDRRELLEFVLATLLDRAQRKQLANVHLAAMQTNTFRRLLRFRLPIFKSLMKSVGAPKRNQLNAKKR